MVPARVVLAKEREHGPDAQATGDRFAHDEGGSQALEGRKVFREGQKVEQVELGRGLLSCGRWRAELRDCRRREEEGQQGRELRVIEVAFDVCVLALVRLGRL